LTRKKHDSQSQYWYTYHEGTNQLKMIGTGTPDTLADYTWDANGNLKSAPNLGYHWEYRNLPWRIGLVHPNWTNDLKFYYDGDGRRVKKEYRKGRSCECGPDPLLAPPPPGTSIDRPIRIRPSSEVPDTLTTPEPTAPPPGRGLTESTPPAGTDIGTSGDVTIAGPIGDCVCYDKTTTEYIRTYDGRVMRVMEDGQFARDFIYAGDRRIAVYEDDGSYGDLFYFVTDHLGSTRALVDSTGDVQATYDYYPYGTLKYSLVSTDTKMRYTGKELDDNEIRQHYFGARYLNTTTLYFNSIDPQEDRYPGWSPYCYALANPMRLVDPDGEQTVTYDRNRFLELRERILGWAPAWVQEIIMPSTPDIVPSAMAAGPVARGAKVAAKASANAIEAGVTRAITKAKAFLQAAANEAEKIVGGKGPRAGTAKHEVLKQEIKTHGKELGLSSEISYKGGEPVKYGTKGSVRIDAVLGPEASPIATFDLKTGRATLAPQRMRTLREHLPTEPVIEEIKPNLPLE
jgi:RHS repeat-associated protein